MKHSTAAPAGGLVLAADLINAQPPQAKLGPTPPWSSRTATPSPLTCMVG